MSLFETREKFRSGSLGKNAYIDEMHKLHSQLFEYAEFLRETDIARIELSDGSVVMTSRSTGVKVCCDPRDKRIPPVESLNFGWYERFEMDMVLRIVQPGFTVFDIGANIGWCSLNIAKAIPQARVIAFEPLPETYRFLIHNIGLNKGINVCAHNFGFWNEEKEVPFYYCPDLSCSASAANLNCRVDAQVINCRLRKLDEFISESAERPDFIKCDVEGAELFVFQGGMESIRRNQPAILCEMLRKWSAKFNYSPNEIIDLLSDAGYDCYTIDGGNLVKFRRMDENTCQTNFLFLHRNRHNALIRAFAVPR